MLHFLFLLFLLSGLFGDFLELHLYFGVEPLAALLDFLDTFGSFHRLYFLIIREEVSPLRLPLGTVDVFNFYLLQCLV